MDAPTKVLEPIAESRDTMDHDRIFELNNPNAHVFIVPTQEGADTEDQWNGSIGDATMQHVRNLEDNERQLWEDMIHMQDGNIFRTVPSFDAFDRDPFNLAAEDLEDYLKEYLRKTGATPQEEAAVREAITEEIERREASEDIMNLGQSLPFQDWEEFPQMWNSIDMPKTPRDKLIYCGNSRKRFYDFFPEGHPDSHYIEDVLNRMNPEINDNYAKMVVGSIETSIECGLIKPYTGYFLIKMVQEYTNNLSDDCIQESLASIDKCWAVEYKNNSAIRSLEDPLYKLIVLKAREWNQRAKTGESVYSEIKSLGQALFSDLELLKKMRGAHWSKYRNIKRKHAPRVMVRGVDINRCSIQKLKKVLRCSSIKAKAVWLSRPIENLNRPYLDKLIDKAAFSEGEKTDRIIDWLESKAQKAIELNATTIFNQACTKMADAQRNNKVDIPDDEWRMIWAYSRICKEEIIAHVNQKRKTGHEF
jgi:hypothetical protein